MELGPITDDLIADLDGLGFGPPVTHVYNPLIYARGAWDAYCERYGRGRREVLLIGMNPGPPGLSNPYGGGRPVLRPTSTVGGGAGGRGAWRSQGWTVCSTAEAQEAQSCLSAT
jgi:hypothetical protein